MELAKKSDAEILAIANPIMDNLMDASTVIDHDRHVANFTDRLKTIVTKEHLEKVCRQYQSEKGHFADREAVAVFRRPHSIAIVWK
jgi:2C-methyl-D-erythritol 2,4-cyclodiphosphate synthase